MVHQETICLLNDSFPPLIDGVANTVVNYANHLPRCGYNSMVITPDYSDAQDENFSYPIVRYPSIKTQMVEGYPAGIPFSPEVVRRVSRENISLLHTHCPVTSAFMARELRQIVDAPIILTYHTKFDVDIAHIIKNELAQSVCKKVLLSNINACNEIWTVSKGAGENLRALGYEGDYIVMPNGVDFPRGKVSAEKVAAVTGKYNLPCNIPVYLFVGRMMWYKGIRIILDGLAKLYREKQDFRMVFIGDGDDRSEIEAYANTCGIKNNCIFTGAIYNREELRAWYSRADLFLFPSSYDTNGLVVREAAACGLGAVLIKGSCAAEGIHDEKNGFLIEESAESMAACLASLNIGKMRFIGEAASRELYISWYDAVEQASDRYRIVIDNYRSGFYPPHRKPSEAFMKVNSELMDFFAELPHPHHSVQNKKTKE